MASIQQSYEGRYAKLEEGEPPRKKIESEGQKLIKTLVQKQTDTSISLSKELSREKDFERGSNYVSISEKISGTAELGDFLRVVHRINHEEESGRKNTSSASTSRHDRFETYCPLGRQDMEAALAVKPNSLETRLYKFALDNEKSKTRPAASEVATLCSDHPINRLQELESQLLANPVALSRRYFNTRQKMLRASQKFCQPSVNNPENKTPSNCGWDSTEVKKLKPCCEKTREETECQKRTVARVYGCQPQNWYTVENGKIVECNSEGSILKKDSDGHKLIEGIEFNPKSDEEIRRLEKFSKYSRGSPSNVLYVKNLQRNLKEEDIAAIFAKAQEKCEISDSAFSCRLLIGKMRGQAFASFSNVENATTVLECINGSEINGRPMIVQFGRRTTE